MAMDPSLVRKSETPSYLEMLKMMTLLTSMTGMYRLRSYLPAECLEYHHFVDTIEHSKSIRR